MLKTFESLPVGKVFRAEGRRFKKEAEKSAAVQRNGEQVSVLYNAFCYMSPNKEDVQAMYQFDNDELVEV